MPVHTTYPGVYIQELPSGTHTIVGVSTSVTAFIGYLRRGPRDKAVQLLNFGDFQRVFGGLDPQSETSWQVSQFFLNGGTEAWVTRVVDATAPPVWPKSDVPGGTGLPLAPPSGQGTKASQPVPPAGSPFLTIKSANEGTWGTNIYLTIDYLTPPGSGAFNLYATLYAFSSGGAAAPVRTMALTGVTMDPSTPNYLGTALQSASGNFANIITLDTTAGNQDPNSLPPFPSGTILSFTAPAQAIPSVSVQIFASRGGTVTQPVTVQIGQVKTVDDLVAGLQSALAVAGPTLGLGPLTVRSFTSPFPASPAGSYVQVLLTDPLQGGTLLGIATTPASAATLIQTNYHGIRVGKPFSSTPPSPPPPPPPPGPPPPPPDGNPPRGIDIAGSATLRTGVYSLDGLSIVNLLCAPDLRLMTEAKSPGQYLTTASALLNYALRRRAFAILDLPGNIATVADAANWMSTTPPSFGPGFISAAAYYPEVKVPDPNGTQPRQIGVSGTMAGLYGATDGARGVWKAPAGITAALTGVQQLAYTMTDQENGILNPMGMNALRTFPVYGNVSWGARTLASPNPADDDWKYINVRRLTLFIEQSVIRGLQWVVFEPNDETLWAQIRMTVNSFLHPLFQQGAFAGSTPAQAYQVICDASTTTPEDMDNGVVNVLILFAPAKPAEFVVISIQQMAGQSSS